MNLDAIIRVNVKRFREGVGLTQQQLADRAGLSVDAVRKWEGKRGTPDRESLTKMAYALGRKMDDFNLEDPPPPSDMPIPVFFLRVAEEAPEDLRREAEVIVDQLNKRYADRAKDVGSITYPPGVRRARGSAEPLVTVRTGGAARPSDRQAPPAKKAAHVSVQKRRRR